MSVFWVLTSCQTYKTYYGSTYTYPEPSKALQTYRLDISYQNLKALPPYIKNLKNLRMINLSGNGALKLAEVVNELVLLPKLQVLILDSMSLTRLPDNFYKMRQLQHLSLAKNPNLDFDDAFEKIQNFKLEFINLSNNRLVNLPDNFSKIRSLRDLKLSHNQLQTADAFLTLAELPKLRSLWLDDNQISVLAPEIATLRQLRFLYLDNNNLSTLPEAVTQMRRLLVLHAAQNRFTELPGQLARMPGLMFVIFSNNPIEEIPPIFHRTNYSLLALVMDGNLLDEREKIFYKKMFRRFFIFSAE